MKSNQTTEKVKLMLESKDEKEVSQLIGITKPTLYTRLQRNNWKVSEVFLISKL